MSEVGEPARLATGFRTSDLEGLSVALAKADLWRAETARLRHDKLDPLPEPVKSVVQCRVSFHVVFRWPRVC